MPPRGIGCNTPPIICGVCVQSRELVFDRSVRCLRDCRSRKLGLRVNQEKTADVRFGCVDGFDVDAHGRRLGFVESRHFDELLWKVAGVEQPGHYSPFLCSGMLCAAQKRSEALQFAYWASLLLSQAA